MFFINKNTELNMQIIKGTQYNVYLATQNIFIVDNKRDLGK